ncbi:dynein regulatory complex protein 9 [Anabrus simplex]|uniref:dynein regulatory complex protein 9 n=1 Tax=Anabrus simplex TaxID=316456 RepID=UPI0035A3B94B
MGIIAVLQDAVNKLQILSYTYQKPYVKPELVYKSLKERFGVKHESEVLIDRETDQPIETVENTMKLRKLQLDRSFLEEVLIQTIEELQTDGTFFILARIVLQEMVMNAEEKLLIEEEKKNREAVQHLRKQVLGLKKKMMEDLDECEGNIAKLRDKMQDFMFRASAETKFIEKWEFSRMEQNDMALSKKENDLHKALTNNQIGIDIEIRVHNEIEAFLKAAEEKLTNDIEAWSIKYEEDVTHLDDMIIVLNDKKQKQLEELETIMDLYNARQVEIQEFLEYKEAKRLKEEEEELRIKMAIRIQAWWRGTMVRRGLGPYRKKKKDKKGSAKKGKKKKK